MIRPREFRQTLLVQLAAGGPRLKRLAAPQLAAIGDVEAQRTLLEELLAHLEAGDRIDIWAVKWLDAVEDASLFNLLASAIPLAGAARRADEAPSQSVLLPLRGAAERADAVGAISLYDRLITNPPWPGAQFEIDHRDDVVQRLVNPAGETAARQAARRLNLPTTRPGS